MIPGPSRAGFPAPPPKDARAGYDDADAGDDDDEEGWQDMPVIRSDASKTDDALGFDDEDERKHKYQPPVRLDDAQAVVTGNATGTHLELDPDLTTESNWRDKLTQDESDYTRLRLNEDEESEEVHMRTKYLFDEDKAMTPLSQMQATKELLTEGQRIAYVGLCALVARGMLVDMGRGVVQGKGKQKSSAVTAGVESGKLWMLKIMARLYQHMELENAEQKMIESLAEHGVDPSDLVPALMTTHTIKNPEYDPAEVKRQEKLAEEARARKEEEGEDGSDTEGEEEAPPPPYEAKSAPSPAPPIRPDLPRSTLSSLGKNKSSNPFGDDEDDGDITSLASPEAGPSRPRSATVSSAASEPDLEEGDIAAFGDDEGDIAVTSPTTAREEEAGSTTPKAPIPSDLPGGPPVDGAKAKPPETPLAESAPLPGVSTSLSKTDENVTLDIRWTILCDLFLVLIADSVYDSRSRVFLERVAERLGLTNLDVTRFEKRVTDALEIQEGVEKLEQQDVIEGRRQKGKKKRYAMMGLATLGGGLVIGLSAGLLAPVIGAGLGAAFATVGISGTTGFLAGTGGAAVITTGGVLTGSGIAGKGMARRTREVRTFEFKPLHNNKRVNCFITVPGFMASMVDDVRLPFSTLDPIIGDVFGVLWEPEMMNEMGNALRILTSEVLTQVGQTVLQATIMAGLMSALQWPLILTKLGYLIDNPWSNALDRSYAAGLVLADTLMARHAGVRPISLIGFSLGARVIFYALAELARNKAYGIVQDVYLFGATVTASRSAWLDVRSVVSGRLVNGFSTSDWLLGYLFRATSGGVNTVAGLRPVETVPGMENVDVTSKISGHMSYRTAMPLLLEEVGLPITADWFDEPDDPELDMSIQERIIITKEMEEERLRRERKIWGVFPRLSKKNSGQPTFKPTPPPSFGPAGQPTSAKPGETPSEYDEDDEEGDDLGVARARSGTSTPTHAHLGSGLTSPPPHPLNGLGGSASANASSTSLDIPKTAGFDFGAISRVLGKNVDPANGGVIAEPDTRPPGVVPTVVPPPLDRTGSAPPLERAGQGGRPDLARSHTQAPVFNSEVASSMPASPQHQALSLSEDRPLPARQASDTSTSSAETQPATQDRFVPLPPPNMAGLSLDNEWSTPAGAASKTAPLAADSGGWGSSATISTSGFGSSGGKSPFASLWGRSEAVDTGGWGSSAASAPKMAPPARPFPSEYLARSSTATQTGENDDGDIGGFGSGGAGGRNGAASQTNGASKTGQSKWDENPW